MKKIILVVCLFLCILSINVFASSNVEYDTLNPAISYDATNNILTLNNYVDDGSYYYSDTEGDFTIYSDGDLTIELIGDNEIDYNDGIYVEGDLTIIGSGTLDLNYYLTWTGNFNVDDGIVNFIYGTNSYYGNRIEPKNYVHYGTNKFMPFYDPVSGCYYDILNQNPIDEFTVEANAPLANMDNIYDEVDKVYKLNTSLGYDELDNVDGFIIYVPDENTKVEYNSSTKVFTVEFEDDFSDDDYKLHYFELALNQSEWGKLIEYEILDAANVYKYEAGPIFTPYSVGDIYYEPNLYVGSAIRYSKTIGGIEEVGTGYFTFACKKDNYISVKAKGADGTYQIINLKVKDNSSPTIEPTPAPTYSIVNTGVR